MRLFTLFSVALLLAACSVARADILLTNYSIYTQDFNTLASAATSSLMPADWSFSETGVSANGTYTAGTGSSATADTYSFGAAASTERALGELTAASLTSTFGAEFQNAGNVDMTKIKLLSYTGEQWRLGAAGRTDALDFQYSLNATSLTTGTWFDINLLDFIAPVTTGTAGSRDGNLAINQSFVSFSGPPSFDLAAAVAPGGTFWIRWSPRDATSADDGLGIDNFTIQAIPEPSSIALCGLAIGAFGIGLVRRRRRKAS